MRGSVWATFAFAFLLAAILIPCSGPVEAKQLSGHLQIDEGEHYGWRLDVAIPSQIDFHIEGLNGTLVDVLIMDEANYTWYTEGRPFQYYSEFSSLNTSNETANMTVLSGSVYVVIDNSVAPSVQGAAAPHGAAQVEYWIGSTFDLHTVPGYGPSWIMYPVLATVGLTFALVVYFTRKAVKERKRPDAP